MEFEATVQAAGRGGAVVVLPFDPKEAFGRARAPVHGTVNGAPFRSTVAVYGGMAYLGLPLTLRRAARADVGARVHVTIERDDEPREVEVPDDLAHALSHDREAAASFSSLSYTHRKEYVRWITGAKREETRRRRVDRALDLLRDGVQTPD